MPDLMDGLHKLGLGSFLHKVIRLIGGEIASKGGLVRKSGGILDNSVSVPSGFAHSGAVTGRRQIAVTAWPVMESRPTTSVVAGRGGQCHRQRPGGCRK